MNWVIFSTVFIVTLFIQESCGAGFNQEGAKVHYVNSKYLKDLNIFTSRENRRSPYMTNLNFTVLTPVTNNVTIRYEFMNMKMQAFSMKIEIKICDSFKTQWSRDWLEKYTDIPLACPLLPARFHFRKFEVPPKNFPLSFTNEDYAAKTTLFVTSTKEKICELSLILRFSNKNG